MGEDEMFAAVAAAAVTGLLTYLGVRVASSAQKQVARGPDWQAHLDDVREWHEEQLKAVRDRADRAEVRADKWRTRYLALVEWVRELLHRHPDERASMPPEISHEI